MKKIPVVLVALLASLSILLAGCSGTPKPPVKTTLSLDKLVQTGQTVDQVYALMTPALKNVSKLYQARSVQQNAAGAWELAVKQGGYKTGETDAYQVLIFQPAKAGDSAFLIFFKSNSEFNKAWFSADSAASIDRTLQGF